MLMMPLSHFHGQCSRQREVCCVAAEAGPTVCLYPPGRVLCKRTGAQQTLLLIALARLGGASNDSSEADFSEGATPRPASLLRTFCTKSGLMHTCTSSA